LYASCQFRRKLQADQATSSSWEIAVQRTAQHTSDFSGNTSSNSRTESGSNVVQLGVLLGAGSFGRVYKGTWRYRDVAVKVIQHSSRTAELVLNEVNLMLSFNHPNTVRALHVINWVRRQGESGAQSRIVIVQEQPSAEQVSLE
jgi:serine/threonine protein kinase